MKKKKLIWPALVAFIICTLSCSAAPKEEKKELPLDPRASDNLRDLMLKSESNIRFLIYGIINFDAVKIENSTRNITLASQYMGSNTSYQFKGNRAEWEELSQTSQELSESLRQAFLDENYEKMDKDFSELIGVCTDCHLLYWDTKMKDLRTNAKK